MTMNPGGTGGESPLYRIAFEYSGPSDGAQAPGGAVNPEMIGQGADARARSRRTEKREDSNTENSDKQTKILTNHLRSTLGINLGIAAILKQSQIFTGTLGTIFQILGAMVDVVLAAFMPIIVPALKLLAKMIPGIQRAATQMVGWLMKGFTWARDHLGWLRGFFESKFGAILKNIFFSLIVGIFIARLVGAHNILLAALKLGLQLVVGGLKFLLAPLFGIQRNTAVAAARGVGGGMHPGGGAYGGAGRGAASRAGAGLLKMGPLGKMGMGLGVAGLGISGAVAYGTGGMGAGGLGGSLGGMAVGGGIGMLLGGPVGAMIGANIGAVAGPIIGGYLEKGGDKVMEKVRDNHNRLGDRDVMRQNNNPTWLAEYDDQQKMRALSASQNLGPV